MELTRRTRFLLPANPPPSLGTILEELGKLTRWGQHQTHKKTVRSLITRSDKKGYEHSGGAADDCWRFFLNEKVLIDTGSGNCTFDPLAGAATLARARREDPNEAIKKMRDRLDRDQPLQAEEVQTPKVAIPEYKHTDHAVEVPEPTDVADISQPDTTNAQDAEAKTESKSDMTTVITELGQRISSFSTNIETAGCRLKEAMSQLISLRPTP